jgi:hypothetical protein
MGGEISSAPSKSRTWTSQQLVQTTTCSGQLGSPSATSSGVGK